MYELDPMVTFPKVIITGNKETGIKMKKGMEGDNYRFMISFYARRAVPEVNGTYFNYSFIAFNEVAEKIQRMNLKRGSQVALYAEMRSYMKDIGGNMIPQYTFVVKNIGFLDNKKKEQPKPKEKEQEQCEISTEMEIFKNDIDISMNQLIHSTFKE